MTLLLTIGGGLVLSILAAVVCYRRGTPPGFDHLVRLIVVSFSLSGFFATTAIPGFWLAISYGLYGGQLDQHLISDAGNLLAGMIVGILLTLLWGVRGLFAALKPPERE